MPDSYPLVNLTATVRAYFEVSLRRMGRYLGVSAGFVTHVQAGRKGLPATLVPRLLQLSRLLPELPVAVPPAPAVFDPLNGRFTGTAAVTV